MKSVLKKSDKKAFTIVELLTVMSIIVILIGLLVPALNQVKIFAKKVRQQAQFHSIGAALELFNSEFDTLPDSSSTDPGGQAYCGAMKLAEAMVGRDFMGYHPDSVFNRTGLDYSGDDLYTRATMNARKGPYLPIENANAYNLSDVYESFSPFLDDSKVLCDVYGQVVSNSTGLRIGMPILYYKAHPSRTEHLATDPANSIYDYRDNQALIDLGKPWETGTQDNTHELATAERFYKNTQNTQVTNFPVPFNKDTYILISAGPDGEYGTSDDICNFDFKYRN